LKRLVLHFVLAATALVMALPASAAERVTLANGFVEKCDHHENVDGRVRLYLNADATSYIDFASSDIASFENIPDPPPSETESRQGSAHPAQKLNAADLHEMLVKAGQAHHLDVDLLASVVKAESGGNPRATSRAGAGGLMQLMPGTAGELGVADRYAPEQNVRGGSAYLDQLLTRYHDNLALALAAYNAGPAAVAKYHGIPPYRETRLYVARVIHEFNRRVLARERAATQPVRAPHGQ
jgi:soluble lytic murein transglycosylase-like protein